MMKYISIIALLFLGLFIIPSQGTCGKKDSIVEQEKSCGIINWTKGFIQAKGKISPAEKTHDKSLENQEIIKIARLTAIKKLLEISKQVRIDTGSLVGDIAIENSPEMAQIEEMTRKAKMIKQEFLSDGTVEITMRMSLYGGFSQLVLPRDIKPLESIKQTSTGKNQSPDSDKTSKADSKSTSGVLTGLIVDARGLALQPSLFFKICDENNQEVYGSAFVSRDFAVQRGMAGYMKDIKTAETDQRVSKNPLTVKGLRVNSKGLVISNADASRLRSAVEHLKFLKECRVIIVID